MIDSQPTASSPRNSRVPVAPRRQPALRRSAASRPDSADGARWKVQLELAPAEIAFVYRRGLARGAEVCRRGTGEWRPLVITPELRDVLSTRASLAELIAVASDSGSALTPSQSPAVSDPALATLFLAQRATQSSKNTPPPPPPAVSKSAPPPPPPVVSKSEPPPPLVVTHAQSAVTQPQLKGDLVPHGAGTPLVPPRIEPVVPLPRHVTLPSVRLARQREAGMRHARPFELSLVAAVAVLLTLVVTALTLRAEAPSLNALISTATREARAEPLRAVPAARPQAAAAPSTIPVVFWGDLPVEAGAFAAAAASPSRPSRGASSGRSAALAGPNRASFSRALGSAAAAARGCGDGPVNAQLLVTFAPSGVAREIHFAVAPPVALRSCVLNAVARSRVSPFEGEPVTVSKTLRW